MPPEPISPITVSGSWFVVEFLQGGTRYRLWESDDHLTDPDNPGTLARRAESGIWHPVPAPEALPIITALRDFMSR